MNDIMTVRAPQELQIQLGATAKDIGISRNALILQILWDWARQRTIHNCTEDELVNGKTEGGERHDHHSMASTETR